MPREERDAKIWALYEIFIDRFIQLCEPKHEEWLSGSEEIRRLKERLANQVG
jgi:hypothetical protein